MQSSWRKFAPHLWFCGCLWGEWSIHTIQKSKSFKTPIFCKHYYWRDRIMWFVTSQYSKWSGTAYHCGFPPCSLPSLLIFSLLPSPPSFLFSCPLSFLPSVSLLMGVSLSLFPFLSPSLPLSSFLPLWQKAVVRPSWHSEGYSFLIFVTHEDLDRIQMLKEPTLL